MDKKKLKNIFLQDKFESRFNNEENFRREVLDNIDESDFDEIISLADMKDDDFIKNEYNILFKSASLRVLGRIKYLHPYYHSKSREIISVAVGSLTNGNRQVVIAALDCLINLKDFFSKNDTNNISTMILKLISKNKFTDVYVFMAKASKLLRITSERVSTLQNKKILKTYLSLKGKEGYGWLPANRSIASLLKSLVKMKQLKGYNAQVQNYLHILPYYNLFSAQSKRSKNKEINDKLDKFYIKLFNVKKVVFVDKKGHDKLLIGNKKKIKIEEKYASPSRWKYQDDIMLEYAHKSKDGLSERPGWIKYIDADYLVSRYENPNKKSIRLYIWNVKVLKQFWQMEIMKNWGTWIKLEKKADNPTYFTHNIPVPVSKIKNALVKVKDIKINLE